MNYSMKMEKIIGFKFKGCNLGKPSIQLIVDKRKWVKKEKDTEGGG